MQFKKKFKKVVAIVSAVSILSGTLSSLDITNSTNIQVKATPGSTFKSETETIDGVIWSINYYEFGGQSNYGQKSLSSIKIVNQETLYDKKIIIPDTIAGVTVTRIDTGCFANTDVSEVVIPDTVTTIQDGAFANCSRLKKLEINSAKIPKSCFENNTSLESVIIGSNDIGIDAFNNCQNIKSVTFNGKGELYLSSLAFQNDFDLESISFDGEFSKITVDENCFSNCMNLETLSFPCETILFDECFSDCTKLKKAEFFGATIIGSHTSLGGYNFARSFIAEKDNNNNVIEKEVIFHDTAMLNNGSEFQDASGLTKVTFEKDVTFSSETFKNCDKMNACIMKGNVTFTGYSVFSGCSNLKKIDFLENVDTEYNKFYYYSSPFSNSSLEDITFKENRNGDNHVFVDINGEFKSITYETEKFCGTIRGTVEYLIFKNPNAFSNVSHYCNVYNKLESTWEFYRNTYWGYNEENSSEAITYGFYDKTSNRHCILGYSSDNVNNNYVEFWAKNYSDNGSFKNIVCSDIETSYPEMLYGENLTKNDVDLEKLSVKAAYEYDALNYRDIEPSEEDGDDRNGYIIELPDQLTVGDNVYAVKYAGRTVKGTIKVSPILAEKLEIEWNIDKISTLVSNQPVTIDDIVKNATIVYNNGDTESISTEKIGLSKTFTNAGDNTFVVTLSGTDVKAEKTFTIKENYIRDIKAEYDSHDTLYAGDKIDISKIKLIPTYKYNADETVNRNISATKISDTELKAGTNEIKVYYNDLETTMVVSATAVVPTKIYAMLDSNSVFYEGQENIDPKSIVTTIEYNNGTKKVATAEEINCEIIQSTGTNVQVRVSYEGLESIVTIPVTAKEVVSIKANANIASATEGTTLAKTIVDSIEMTYNNGKIETLDASNIKYDELTFNDYAIVADTKNVITVNYLGKSTEITIVGISNTITSIFAEYIGSGQIVGTEIPVSDVAVHAVNSNGQITDITDGVLLENAIPYNVGANTVIVHYGSLSYTINVTGLPAPTATVAPTTTSEAGIIVPTATVVPTQTPKQTSQPSTTQTPVPTQSSTNSNVVVVSPSDIANAPVVANTTVTLKSSNSKIVTATTNTYKVYTNKNVVITIDAVSASNIKYQIVAKGAKLSDTAWKNVVDNKITVSKTTKPSIVYIQYTDANGEVQTIHTNGFSVDKTKATANVKKNKTYKAGKKVTFKDASGIKSAKLDGKKVKSGTKIKKKGTHTLVITDKAGNKTTIKFKVK